MSTKFFHLYIGLSLKEYFSRFLHKELEIFVIQMPDIVPEEGKMLYFRPKIV